MRSMSVAAAFVLVLSARALADDVTGPAPAAPPETKAAEKGLEFLPGTPPFAEVLAKAKAEGKPVFVDFTTDWCGWCRKMEKDTFALGSVGELMKQFVNVQVDAEKGEGPDLKKKYGVSGYPTFVIVDAAGEEIDRLVGYKTAEPFTKEINRILAGDNTLPALTKKYAEAPDDVDAGVALGTKLAVGRPDAAADVFVGLAEKAKSKDRATQGRVQLEYAAALLAARKIEPAAAEAEKLVSQFADTPAAASAAARVGRAFAGLETKRALAFLDNCRGIAKEVADKAAVESVTVTVLKNAMAAALKRQGIAAAAGDDPMRINAVAWECFEQKVNVKDAIGWAKKGVEMSGGDVMIMDTLANLLWISGQRDEAIKVETEAAAKAEGSYKRDFDALVAKWTAELAEMNAKKAGAK